ncbi:MAG: radical SAM protein [Pseudomonadota bacterium]
MSEGAPAPARPYPYPRGLVVELTSRCDHACDHCYNVWKLPGVPAPEPLPSAALLTLLDRVVDEAGLRLLTLTGGEPLLHPDFHAIVEHLAPRVGLNLITHGGHLDTATIARLVPDRVRTWELPLLAGRRGLHDALSGRAGAFDRVTAAIAELKAARQRVVVVFVVLRPNLDELARVVELCVALGVDGLMLNRFNPGGSGARHVARLQADPAALQVLLDEAEVLAARWELPMACSIALPPCLLDLSRHPHLATGFCALGTENAYYTVDPAGWLRPCNHSPTRLGDLGRRSLCALLDGQALADYVAARPALCAGCALERRCQGGCKAAAEACTGSPWEPDPFLGSFKDRRRPGGLISLDQGLG